LSASEFSEQELSLKETTIFFTEKIQRRFSKSPKEALAIFQHFLENKGKQETVAQGKGAEAVPLHNDGVIITIRNNHPSYEIEIANLLSPGAGETLRRIMTGLAIVLLDKSEVKSEVPAILQAVESIKKEDAAVVSESSDAQTRAASATASAPVDSGNLDFFPPKNKSHDSWSITNTQSALPQEAMTFKVISLTDLIEEYPSIGISDFSMLKLDIEGAESEIMKKLFTSDYKFDFIGIDSSIFGS
jgi:FkbM family methyltransferase